MGRRDKKSGSSSRSRSRDSNEEEGRSRRNKGGDRSRNRSSSSSPDKRKKDQTQKGSPSSSRSRSKENTKTRNNEKDNKQKERKNRKHSKSSSSSSSSGSDNNDEDDKKKADEFLKITKMRKDIIERELQYRGEENPFGDKDIAETLNWGKSTKNQNKSIHQIEEEIVRIKQIREQRKDDERRLEDMRTKAITEREEENYQQWKQKEEMFHAYQARIRALVRITQGKETTVDKINKIFYIYRRKIKYSEHLDPIMSNIQSFIKKQDEDELEKILAQAINHHNQLNDPIALTDQQYKDEQETQKFATFWESIKAITQYYLDELRKKDSQKEVLPEFENAVKAIFEGKSLEELLELEKDIISNIQMSSFGAQEEHQYWQSMNKRLQLHKGDAVLKTFYDYFITHQNEFQAEDALEIEVENKVKLTDEQILSVQIQNEQQEAEAHVYSPILMPMNEETARSSQTQGEFRDSVVELRQVYFNKILKRALNALEMKRERESKLVDTSVPILGGIGKQDREDVDAATLRLLEMEKKKPMEDGESVFDDLQALDGNYNWSEKYKSKKPRYFNRVKQGFDWNKYNRTHYDSDNPPPKYIQGYKFNIFYSELVDMEQTPQYFLEECDEPGFCIIRFSAGPPYEDIAFKIIKREWDYADKKGFKCYFNRGVLTLHFNFKRSISRR